MQQSLICLVVALAIILIVGPFSPRCNRVWTSLFLLAGQLAVLAVAAWSILLVVAPHVVPESLQKQRPSELLAKAVEWIEARSPQEELLLSVLALQSVAFLVLRRLNLIGRISRSDALTHAELDDVRQRQLKLDKQLKDSAPGSSVRRDHEASGKKIFEVQKVLAGELAEVKP